MNIEVETIEVVASAQQPIIDDQIEEIANRVQQRIDHLQLSTQTASEDTIIFLKQTRSELNKELHTFEEQRKAVKEIILGPYQAFEEKYKMQIKSLYDGADNTLKVKIQEFELHVLAQKKQTLESYFEELSQQHQLHWLSFNQLSIKVKLSTSLKKYKEEVHKKITSIPEDLALIDTETHQVEILVLYKKTLNVSQSIQTVRKRKQDEKQEAERIQFERSTKRTAQLRTMSFVYSDLIRSYYYIHDQAIHIKLSDIENLADDHWQKHLTEVSQIIKYENKKAATQPLQAPIVTQASSTTNKEAEQYTASFSVTGTFEQLTELTRYLKENKIQYKQINNSEK